MADQELLLIAAENHEARMPVVKNEHARGLLLVGLFKLSKTVFFAAVGAAALHLINSNPGEMLMNVLAFLHLPTQGHYVNMLMDRADLLGHHQLREGAMLSFGYATLCLVEGVGLMTYQVWAEYLTVVLTTGALPFEIYELLHKFEPYKVGVLILNLIILLYLVWVLKRKKVETPDVEAA
jgi:uncharacterized membrane protein (DUF2068 family)